ncbi:MAG: branched-chain amino acid ABC transporter permease [Candidatus Firestonebacteria bacterium]
MNYIKNNVYTLSFLAALAVPFFINRPDYLSVFVITMIYIILALGLNIVVGFCGLLALGFAAFYGIGAYITAILTVKFGFTFFPAIIFVIIGSGIVGFASGLPVMRLRGDYLAIVTLGLGEITRIFINNFESLTNGPKGISGIPNPSFFGISFTTPWSFYYLLLVFTGFSIYLVRALENSRIGRAWIAIREDEIAASSVGINITKMKLFAFVLGSIMAGLAGFLFAQFQTFVSPDSFTFIDSAMILCAVVLGGLGSIPGVIIGSIILSMLPELLRDIMPGFADYRMLFFGMILIVMMLFRPQGIFSNLRRKAELFPASEAIKNEEDESLAEDRRR